MSIFKKCWKKQAPRVNELTLFSQQDFVFGEVDTPGVFAVKEIRRKFRKVEDDEVFDRCTFPLFYKGFLGRLISRRRLYIAMWDHSDDPSLKSFPDFPEVFKHIRRLAEFTDKAVEIILNDASRGATSIWVPELLREWLVLEFHVGHGSEGAQRWFAAHTDPIDPAEFGMLHDCAVHGIGTTC